MIELDQATISLLTGLVIPLLTGLFTKLHASSTVKSVVNAILTVIAGAVAVLAANTGPMRWQELVLNVGLAFASSGTSYSHLWKPTGVAPAVQQATASLGLGSNAEPVKKAPAKKAAAKKA